MRPLETQSSINTTVVENATLVSKEEYIFSSFGLNGSEAVYKGIEGGTTATGNHKHIKTKKQKK